MVANENENGLLSVANGAWVVGPRVNFGGGN